ncbi:MAG: nitroreductase family protein [Armatimonadota bacterium]
MTHADYRPVPLDFRRFPRGTQLERARDFAAWMLRRRTVRHFSSEPVSIEIIEAAIAVASSAPSGANRQPWTFVVVNDPAVKRRIREAAEAEERESYEHRMPDDWLEALAPLGTDWRKEFLEIAPYLIVVFRQDYGLSIGADGQEQHTKHYYVMESVGIACGFLLAALHWAGLATLTHTPSPMAFLSTILGRPKNEKPYLLIPLGYPAADAVVPQITKKTIDQVRVVINAPSSIHGMNKRGL